MASTSISPYPPSTSTTSPPAPPSPKHPRRSQPRTRKLRLALPLPFILLSYPVASSASPTVEQPSKRFERRSPVKRSPPNQTPRALPDKYVLAPPSSSWTPVGCWYLHGRSNCPRYPPPPDNVDVTPNPSIDSTDDFSNNASNSADTTSTATPSASTPVRTPVSAPTTVDPSSLPRGWTPKTPRSSYYPVPGIVVGSVILAVMIVLTIWVTGVWRKRGKERRRLQAKLDVDVEKKGGPTKKKKKIETDDDEAEEKERLRRRAKQWEKAVHRWRDGVRVRRRRRKSDKASTSAADPDPGVSYDDDDQPGPDSTTQAQGDSRPISPSPSLASSRSPTPAPLSAPPAHPPAYCRPSSSASSFSQPSPLPPPSTSASPPPPLTPRTTAHVATDDKSLLAHLNSLRSAPNPHTEEEPTVPEWTDESVEDFPPDEAPDSTPSILPPPPAPLVTSSTIPIAPMPSAPPEEPLPPHIFPSNPAHSSLLYPSAPTFDSEEQEASAPPLNLDDGEEDDRPVSLHSRSDSDSGQSEDERIGTRTPRRREGRGLPVYEP